MADWSEKVTVRANGQDVEVSLDDLRRSYASAQALNSAEIVEKVRNWDIVARGMQENPLAMFKTLGDTFDFPFEATDDSEPTSGQQQQMQQPDLQAMIAKAVADAVAPVAQEFQQYRNATEQEKGQARANQALSALRSNPRFATDDKVQEVLDIAKARNIDLDTAGLVWQAQNPLPPETKMIPFMSSGRPKGGLGKEPAPRNMDNLDELLSETVDDLLNSGKITMNSSGALVGVNESD
jgi:hypothetical protein